MNYKKTNGWFRSSNGASDAAYYIYTPEDGADSAKGIVQISHGMCEYIERYENFIDYLCGMGFIVCGNHHIGHGNSVKNDDELGYFAPDNGWMYLAKDVVKLTRIMKEKYPLTPYFLLGHSMGSLIARTALAKYSEIYDGALILGTINIPFGMDACLALIESSIKLRGEKSRSKTLNRMMFGMSNSRIPDPETEYDWICSDMDVVREYAADPRCNFIFTGRAMYDLMMLVKYVSARSWAGKLRKELPVFIASGSEDPVGRYGKCPRELFERMTAAGIQKAELHIYPEMRHEILNEEENYKVYADISGWLDEMTENEENL